MKVGFFGTPEIASRMLEALAGRHDVLFAVTGEDKARGRHRHLQPPPAKETALDKNIDVIQPKSLRDEPFIDTIKNYGADAFVVVAYGKIIPSTVFNLPRHGTVNLHPSLLPKYRGAAPIEWALINGEAETGVTVQRINEDLDAGDVILQETIALDETMTAADLYERVIPLGAELLLMAMDLFEVGKAEPRPQDHEKATYCGKLERDTARIDWNRPAEEIHNLVRGLNPKPVAWTTFREKNIRIWRTLPFDGDHPVPQPGELAVHGKKRLLSGAVDGALEIITLQPETKKTMDGQAFINGHRIAPGDRFE